MTERAELAVNLARKDYFMDYALSGGYYNQGGMPPMYSFRADASRYLSTFAPSNVRPHRFEPRSCQRRATPIKPPRSHRASASPTTTPPPRLHWS